VVRQGAPRLGSSPISVLDNQAGRVGSAPSLRCQSLPFGAGVRRCACVRTRRECGSGCAGRWPRWRTQHFPLRGGLCAARRGSLPVPPTPHALPLCGSPCTRLETRTKESTARASTVVTENLFCVLKGSAVIRKVQQRPLLINRKGM